MGRKGRQDNASVGFFFDELTDFKKELLQKAFQDFPAETDFFLKEEAKQLSKIQKKIAKREVGTARGKKKYAFEHKSYHQKFKVGKVYSFAGDRAVRAYNGSPVAQLIEYGHRRVPRGKKGQSNEGGAENGYTQGKYILKKSEIEFKEEFFSDCDDFLSNYFDDIGN